MRRTAPDPATVMRDAFMRHHRPHRSRLPYQAPSHRHALGDQIVDEPADAQAAHFLIVGKRNAYALPQLAGLRQRHEIRHSRQHAGNEAFHVGAAAPIQAPIAAIRQLEWRIGPVLPIHRHHVAMAGQDNQWQIISADAAEQISLAAVVAMGEPACQPVAGKITPYPFYQLQIGIPAGGIEADQFGQQVGECGIHGAWRVYIRWLDCRVCTA